MICGVKTGDEIVCCVESNNRKSATGCELILNGPLNVYLEPLS